MHRTGLWGLVFLGLLAPASSHAVDLTAESAKIHAAFREKSTTIGTDRAAFEAAVDERNEALAKLAAQAEQENPDEHAGLARLYLQIVRYADAAKHAQAAVDANPSDAAMHGTLISALCSEKREDAAVAAFNKLLAVPVDDKNVGAVLGVTSSALPQIAGLYNSAGKFDESERLIAVATARVDGLRIVDDEARNKVVDNAKRAIAYVASRTQSEIFRAKLIGQAYFPIEQPTWLNGEPISPEQLHGKVILLDFWAVWCGPCIATFPHLIEWHEKYADKGLVIIGVTRRYQFDWDAEVNRPKRVEDLAPELEDAATVAFAKHHGLKHRLAVVAPDADLSRKYGVTGIPQAVIVDQSGVIRLIKVGSGEANAQAVEAEIRKLLGPPHEPPAE